MIGVDALIAMVFKVIDKVIPDPVAKQDAQRKLIELSQAGEFKDLEARYSAILAEANSADPWTSRARPSFMYVFYVILLGLVLITPGIGIFYPVEMAQFFVNVAAGFKAIPDALWATFTAGYLGYTYARTQEKFKGVAG
jgi:Holin of 3TMs, for gene-transfer release